MKKTDIMTLEAVGEFPFEFFIEKAVATDDVEMILEGVASTTNIDHDHERMTEEAIESMANVINETGVPLRVEHSKEDEAIIGTVFQASVDERNQLHIKARLNKDHMVAPILYNAMKGGAKMGFSVGGVVKRAVQEFSEKLGKVVKSFYEVALQEVSVTPRPANYDAWCIAKSIAKDEAEVELLRGTEIYNKFLFENPRLDYLQAFAKSIPDEAWRKTASQPNSQNMTKETTRTETATEDTTKAVSRTEFNTLTKTVGQGFKAIMGVLSKMNEGEPKDQVNPDQTKPIEEGLETAKADGDALDQTKPDKDKPETETATKAEEETETSTKAEDSTTGEYDLETIQPETIQRTIKSMDAMTKRLTKT